MIFTPTKAQKIARKHLAKNKEALLFMGCGLGKTATCLSLLDDLILDGVKGVLVVAPLRVANMTWANEVTKFENFHWIKVANLRTKKGMEALKAGKADIYVINYEKLPWLFREYMHGRRKKDYAFNAVIWDEITAAKNPSSKRINAVRRRFREVLDYHWGLTGTPTPNSLLELFAQSRLIDGGKHLGRTYGDYKRNYFRPIDRFGYQWEIRKGCREAIYKRMEGYALTLLSSDWLDIPDVIEKDVMVKLPAKVRKDVYKPLQDDLFVELEEEVIDGVNAAVLVNKLRQISSGMVYTEDGEVEIHKEKLIALTKLIGEIRRNGENALIVYDYKHERKRLTNIEGVVFFDEAKTDEQQRQICKRWNEGKIRFLAVHPKSVSHGLNLQDGGNNIVWFSPNHSREQYEQLFRRLARTGQDKVTVIHRIIAEHTVDEAIIEVLKSKDENQAHLLNALKTFKESY